MTNTHIIGLLLIAHQHLHFFSSLSRWCKFIPTCLLSKPCGKYSTYLNRGKRNSNILSHSPQDERLGWSQLTCHLSPRLPHCGRSRRRAPTRSRRGRGACGRAAWKKGTVLFVCFFKVFLPFFYPWKKENRKKRGKRSEEGSVLGYLKKRFW